MNLNPRRVRAARDLIFSPASRPPDFVLREQALSIWRMELPSTSYVAPQAAFWWVSNEGIRPVRGLISSRRA